MGRHLLEAKVGVEKCSLRKQLGFFYYYIFSVVCLSYERSEITLHGYWFCSYELISTDVTSLLAWNFKKLDQNMNKAEISLREDQQLCGGNNFSSFIGVTLKSLSWLWYTSRSTNITEYSVHESYLTWYSPCCENALTKRMKCRRQLQKWYNSCALCQITTYGNLRERDWLKDKYLKIEASKAC